MSAPAPDGQEPADWLLPLTLVTMMPCPLSLVLGIVLRRWLRPRGFRSRIGYFAWWLLLTLLACWSR